MLRDGTYIREPDGANHLFYSPTRWNDAAYGFRANRGAAYGSLWYWEQVTDPDEYDDPGVRVLTPGEYVEVPTWN